MLKRVTELDLSTNRGDPDIFDVYYQRIRVGTSMVNDSTTCPRRTVTQGTGPDKIHSL